MNDYNIFRENLLKWFSNNHRPMPWKGEKNPYLVWLSEIILQQTRVEQGLPYFERFRNAYPTIIDLANAPEDEVLKLWEGLGYYSRAQNLHATAKYISNHLNGFFPTDYQDILKLKGVGAYTAAAIASFAYGQPYAVLDGNVYRVLSRYFGIKTPIDSHEAKYEFSALAQILLDKSQPDVYNQAIMDFGATHCTPKQAKCNTCFMNKNCYAFQNQLVGQLPIKAKKGAKKIRYFNYLVIQFENKLFLQKRIQKDIWQNLYEFPLIETLFFVKSWEEISKNEAFVLPLPASSLKLKSVSEAFKQNLTHQQIIATFWELETDTVLPLLQNEALITVEKKDFVKFAFPKTIDFFLKNKTLYLTLF